uniref:C-type lectin domain-containing protein n=1 Tax=Chrysemys picta bellii TaxID=8478 RepID=A0A8C3FS11_CHRPI
MSSGIGCGSPLRQKISLICRFWAQNEPNNYDPGTEGGEDCVYTEPSKRNLWNDAKCNLFLRWGDHICPQYSRCGCTMD